MNKLRAIFGTVSVLSIALGAGAPAFAGEGGVAGSATFLLNDGKVTQSSVAGAIGKSNATATSGGAFGITAATAFGSAGELSTNLTVGGSSALSYSATGKEGNLGKQENNIDGEIKLTPKEGKVNY